VKSFDVFTAPISGKWFLEASAGTGKTFTIEHIVARLIREEGLKLEEIVVVTFTRKAARELKERIRARLFAEGLSDALALFDRVQVFTIHAFCQKILTEFAFEAQVGFGIEYWAEAEEREAALSFLREQADGSFLSASQAAALLKEGGRDVTGALLRSQKERGLSFAQTHTLFSEQMRGFQGVSIEEEFERVRPHYKKMTSSHFPRQVTFLQKATKAAASREEFDDFLATAPLFLEQLFDENLKVKSPPQNHPALSRLQKAVLPLLKAAATPLSVLRRMAYAWEEKRASLSQETNKTTHDELLRCVEKCLEKHAFIAKVRSRYKAAIIDEFQDTDPIQWKIFKTLFFTDEIKAFYLVGDPKQSIYGFRGADVYTYMLARECFGEENRAVLTKNYRTCQGLGKELNRLFCVRPWIDLPKIGAHLPVLPLDYVKEGGGLLQFLIYEKEEVLFSFVAREIKPEETTAILVKDRHQARRISSYLKMCGIPYSIQRGVAISEMVALEAMKELVFAVLYGKGMEKLLAGPLCRWTEEDFTDARLAEALGILSQLRGRLIEKGFTVFYAAFLKTSLAAPQGVDFYHEAEAVAQLLATEGDPERLVHLLGEIEKESLEEKILGEQQGAAILTMHMSKGLEFDTVFALGLSASSESETPEADAEKMRQLYVACTRAKRRLFIPKKNGESILSLFWERVEPDLTEFSHLVLTEELLPPTPIDRICAQPPSLPELEWPEKKIVSFSSLAQPSGPVISIPEGILPAGAETGVVVHRILDRFFSGEGVLEKIVSREVAGTVLEEWETSLRELLEKTIDLPLLGFSLRDIPKNQILTEVEFLYRHGGEIVKGFIDLCFEREGRYYIVDWKTNYLTDYNQESLEQAMQGGDYFLQAEIYAEALKQHVRGNLEFGGVFYIFVRGPAVYEIDP